jgi:hypothetical protein
MLNKLNINNLGKITRRLTVISTKAHPSNVRVYTLNATGWGMFWLGSGLSAGASYLTTRNQPSK